MPEALRRFPERHTGKDRGKIFNLHRVFMMGLKEERRCKTEDRRKKDEMVGLEPTNGQV